MHTTRTGVLNAYLVKQQRLRKMAKEDEKGFVPDRVIILKEVELVASRDNQQQIEKVNFVCDKFNITWKPKLHKTRHQGGFTIKETVPMEIDFLPKKLQELAMAASEAGQIEVRACYQYWTTEKDGQEVTYRFLNSDTQLETWVIVKKPIAEEKVELAEEKV